MAVTERLLPQELQVTKYRRFSPLLSSVSGDLQVLQVTYSPGVNCQCLGAECTEEPGAELTEISPQHVLDLLLLNPSIDHQSPGSVHASTRS